MKKFFLLITATLFFASLNTIMPLAEENQTERVKMIDNGSMVKVDYTLTVDGQEIDSSKGRDPLEFEVGKKQMIPGFESAVIGLKKGDKKSFTVSPEDGYGTVNQEAFQEVPKTQLPPDITPEPGMMLSAMSQDGKPFQVKIHEVKDDVLIVDFNHPLAGKELNFEVEVVDVN